MRSPHALHVRSQRPDGLCPGHRPRHGRRCLSPGIRNLRPATGFDDPIRTARQRIGRRGRRLNDGPRRRRRGRTDARRDGRRHIGAGQVGQCHNRRQAAGGPVSRQHRKDSLGGASTRIRDAGGGRRNAQAAGVGRGPVSGSDRHSPVPRAAPAAFPARYPPTPEQTPAPRPRAPPWPRRPAALLHPAARWLRHRGGGRELRHDVRGARAGRRDPGGTLGARAALAPELPPEHGEGKEGPDLLTERAKRRRTTWTVEHRPVHAGGTGVPPAHLAMRHVLHEPVQVVGRQRPVGGRPHHGLGVRTALARASWRTPRSNDAARETAWTPRRPGSTRGARRSPGTRAPRARGAPRPRGGSPRGRRRRRRGRAGPASGRPPRRGTEPNDRGRGAGRLCADLASGVHEDFPRALGAPNSSIAALRAIW
jgi:hypothetical protein